MIDSVPGALRTTVFCLATAVALGGCGSLPDHLDPDAATDSDKQDLKKLAADAGNAFSIVNPWKVGGFAAGIKSGETEAFYNKAIDWLQRWGRRA